MNNDELFITQHLGLGDAIICQSIVKTYAKKYNKVLIPCFDIYQQSIKKIYQNTLNVELFIIKFDGDIASTRSYKVIHELIEKYKNNALKIGFFSPIYNNICNKFKTLNSTFYIPAKIPQQMQWQLPVIQRDKKQQMQLFKRYNVIENEYILIIQDVKRLNQNRNPMIINRQYIGDKSLPQINLQKFSNNVFDNCYLIQNAKQLHLYDSVFTHVVDQCCVVQSKKCFNHKYIRPQQKRLPGVYKYEFINITNREPKC